MKMNTPSAIATLCIFYLLPNPIVFATDQLTLSAGADYSTGHYGDTTETEIWYLPLSIKHEFSRFTYKLTFPYIQITGPGSVVGADANPGNSNTNESVTESGIGDVIVAASYSFMPYQPDKIFIELTNKIKIPTADKTKQLGTGEYDYSLQLDGFYTVSETGFFTTLGYKIYGDPPDIDYQNTYFYSLGATYTLTNHFSGGMVYDFRQSPSRTGIDQQELTAFASLKLDKVKKLLFYIVKGLSEGSPEQGIGFSFSYTL